MYIPAASYPISIGYCDGTGYASTVSRGPITAVTDSLQEIITDGLGKSQAHNVVHKRHRVLINKDPSAHMQGIGPSGGKYGYDVEQTPNYWTYEHSLIHASCISWDLFSSNCPKVPPRWIIDTSQINEAGLKEDCLERAYGLKADVMLNLVEANQIWPAIKSLTGCIGEISYNWKRIRKVIRTASGAYLAWKFGISPILSDVMAIDRYLPKLAADIKRHQNGDKTRVSAKAIIPAQYSPYLAQSYLNGMVASSRVSQGRVTRTPEVRYVLVVKPTVHYQTELFNSLDLCMRRFATSPAQLAWEKIPFSFMVDWLVDVRGTLRYVDNIVRKPPYEVVSFTRSFGYGVDVDSFWQRRSPCPGNAVLHDAPAGTSQCSYYERSVVSDTASLPFLKPRFGKNQAGITAALIAQKITSLSAKR